MMTSASFRSKSIEPRRRRASLQDLEQLAHQLERRHQRRVALQQRRIAIGEDAVDRGVGHPLVAVDDAVVELVAHDRAAPIDLHEARLHQPIDVRVQAAQAGRQLRREHVHGALGKVDRRAALVGLAIERAALLHVVRDVGDVHAEPEVAVRQLLDRDRIVEVARVLAVDRHRRAGRGSRCGRGCRARDTASPSRTASATASGGVRVGNAVLADDDLGVDARRVDVAEHFGDAADGAARRGRPARELDDDHLARRRAAFLAGRHEDVHQHAPIERHDVAHAVLVAVVAADDPRVAALEDADDAPFDAAAFLDPLDARDDAVAVHRLVQVRSRDVDVAAAVERPLGDDEAVAAGMRLQPADVQVHLFGQAEALAANLDEIAGRRRGR